MPCRSPDQSRSVLEGPLRPADGQVDQVGDDGAGGRHLARAPAVIERVADGVADHVDGVVGAAHLGQRGVRAAAAPARRAGPAGPSCQPGLGQQLDGVAQFAGEADVQLRRCSAMPRRSMAPTRHGDAEGDLGQDGQLVGGVGAVHVEGRVGLGVAALAGPRPGPRRSCGRARVMPVRMKLQVPLRMPCSDRIWLAARPCGRAAMIGMPPATLASKAMARPCLRAASKTSAPCCGQQRLVGGDHVLAGRQQVEHRLLGPVDAADHLDGDLHRRIGEHLRQVGGDQLARQGNGARLRRDRGRRRGAGPAAGRRGRRAGRAAPAAAGPRRRRRCRSRSGRCRTVPFW